MALSPYSMRFSLEVVDTISKKYSRATAFLYSLYGYDREMLAKVFSENQKRWETYRKCVHLTEKLLNYYTNVKHIDEKRRLIHQKLHGIEAYDLDNERFSCTMKKESAIGSGTEA